jgi:glycine/D-amino acid oxidase-like deaminating enzyme
VSRESFDVAVIGAGIAGLAACVLLRQRGFRVLCVDAEPHPHRKVGESLDWSSPALLARLGIGAEQLLRDEVATVKRRIVVCECGRPEWMAMPIALFLLLVAGILVLFAAGQPRETAIGFDIATHGIPVSFVVRRRAA